MKVLEYKKFEEIHNEYQVNQSNIGYAVFSCKSGDLYIVVYGDRDTNTWRLTCENLGITGLDLQIEISIESYKDAIDIAINKIQSVAKQYYMESKKLTDSDTETITDNAIAKLECDMSAILKDIDNHKYVVDNTRYMLYKLDSNHIFDRSQGYEWNKKVLEHYNSVIQKDIDKYNEQKANLHKKLLDDIKKTILETGLSENIANMIMEEAKTRHSTFAISCDHSRAYKFIDKVTHLTRAVLKSMNNVN